MFSSGTTEITEPFEKITIRNSISGLQWRFYAGPVLIGFFYGLTLQINTAGRDSRITLATNGDRYTRARVYDKNDCKVYSIQERKLEEADGNTDQNVPVYSSDVVILAHSELPHDINLPRIIIYGDRIYECVIEKSWHRRICRISDSGSVVAVLRESQIPFVKSQFIIASRFDQQSTVFLALLSMSWDDDPS